MDLHMNKLDAMLLELRQDKNLELNLSKIIRTIITDFDFQSLGIFLKVQKSGIYRLKIGRNLSHNFEKSAIYKCEDPLLMELSDFQIINVTSQKRYKFELDFSNLIIIPLFNNKSLLGFLFIDKAVGNFSKDEITRLSIFSSIISIGANLDNLREYIFHLTDTEEISKLYNHKAFLRHGQSLFAQSDRYNRDISLVALKLNNYENIIRTIGVENSHDLIQQISNILRNNLRDTDIMGKIYNDTFALVLPETTVNSCQVPIKRLNERIANLPLMTGYKFGWGVMDRSNRKESFQEMLRNVEEAAFESNRNPDSNVTVYQ